MYEGLVRALRLNVEYRQADNALANASRAADAIDELEFVCNRYEKDYKALCEYLPKWIPVTERLPEDGSDILAVQSYCGEVRIVPANYDRDVWYDCVYNRVAEHITHWMPVPKPPKTDEPFVKDIIVLGSDEREGKE